jgi:small subunit ribosomal protein S20
MATHKSAEKAHIKSLKNKARNSSLLNKIKTSVTNVETMIASKNVQAAQEAFRKTESEIMRGVSKNVLKLNTAARKVSRLANKVKALAKSA